MYTEKSGSFNTTSREFAVVREYFKRILCPVNSLKKCESKKDGDIAVSTPYGNLLVEVKFENPRRWKRWGQYGFEGECYYGDRVYPSKVDYSKSDIWLFYTYDDDDNLEIHGYWFNKPIFKWAQDKAREAGRYYRGHSYNEELRTKDWHESSVYYVNPSDLEEEEICDVDMLRQFIDFRETWNKVVNGDV